MLRRWIQSSAGIRGVIVALALARAPAVAQSLPAQEVSPSKGIPEIVVTAPADAAAARPIMQLSPADIQSYGVDSLSDLLDALEPLTRSSRSGNLPVVLINGHLATKVQQDNIPWEAILRVDILPETVALAYGFSEDQRVVDIVLRKHFRAVTGELKESRATEGGGQADSADASFTRVEDDAVDTVRVDYRKSDRLLYSQRDIPSADGDFLTLLPGKEETKLAGTLSGSASGISSSVEASVDLTSSESLQGLAATPAGIPGPPLDQSINGSILHLAGQLTGLLGRFSWLVLGNYDRTASRSLSDTGLESGDLVMTDRGDSTLQAGALNTSISGPVTLLPAGPSLVNLKLGFQYQGFATQSLLTGSAVQADHYARAIRSASVNTNLPLTSVERDVLPMLGDVSLSLYAGAQQVSDFGSLASFKFALNWKINPAILVNAALADTQTAPTAQQLQAPTLVTPNVEVFDFVTGETAYVTELTGGNGELAHTDDRIASLGLFVGPILGGATLTADYEHHRIGNAVGPLPPVTAAVEAAFPARFARDAAGDLVEIDDRSVNLALEDRDDLKWGVQFSQPTGGDHSAGTPSHLRFRAAILDTWYFRDSILVRNGVAPLDLLNGSPSTDAGGQPRHRIDFVSGIYDSGLGAQVNAVWHGATDAEAGASSAAEVLMFSSLVTEDLRLFADLGRIPALRGRRWARDARITLSVTNVSDSRQTVHDALGQTPTAFLPGYLNPLGRLVALNVRKVF